MTIHWPTSQESFDIEARSRELCSEAFDGMADVVAYDWLFDNRDSDDIVTLAEIAIRISCGTQKSHDGDALRTTTDRLRDHFVAVCAHLYRAQAEAERDEYEAAKAESLHDDRMEER